MDKKVERVKLRINRLTILSFREFKRLKYGDPNIPISDSYVVEEAYKIVEHKLEFIPWEEVNKAKISNVTDDTEYPATSLPTTLSLESNVLSGLKSLQKELVDKAKSRIFFSFVIKIVMYAAILELNGELEEMINK